MGLWVLGFRVHRAVLVGFIKGYTKLLQGLLVRAQELVSLKVPEYRHDDSWHAGLSESCN